MTFPAPLRPRRFRSVAVSVAATMFVLGALGATGAEAQNRYQDRSRSPKSEKVVQTPQTRAEQVKTSFQFPVGSIVIVNNERRLYYITGVGEAVRYKVAVGKNEELWMGRTFVAAKIVDPKWIPVNGDDPVEGGDPANPLGKRALYIDWSLLRIHGTPSRGSIGAAVSNGCIRMLNEDVMNLFERVHFGAPVYAIRSWKEATLYESSKVAEKLYHDPQAHEQAKEDLQEQLRERGLDGRDKDASARSLKKSRAAASSVRVNGKIQASFQGRVASSRESRGAF